MCSPKSSSAPVLELYGGSRFGQRLARPPRGKRREDQAAPRASSYGLEGHARQQLAGPTDSSLRRMQERRPEGCRARMDGTGDGLAGRLGASGGPCPPSGGAPVGRRTEGRNGMGPSAHVEGRGTRRTQEKRTAQAGALGRAPTRRDAPTTNNAAQAAVPALRGRRPALRDGAELTPSQPRREPKPHPRGPAIPA